MALLVYLRSLYLNNDLCSRTRRFRVIDLVGQGTFGQVVKCEDLSNKRMVAIKVIKNKPAYYNQAFMEIRILKHVRRCCYVSFFNVDFFAA